MAWVKMDDKFPSGPKVKRAALALGMKKGARTRVLGVWVAVMGYCNLNETDGFIPDFEVADIDDVNPVAVFEAMAQGVGETPGPMVERVDGRKGWQIRNYAEYQPTRAQLEAKRKADKDRKESKRKPGGVRAETSRTPDGQEAVPATPARSGPSQPDQNQDQVPRASSRPVFPQAVENTTEIPTVADIRAHLRAACHRLIEGPDSQFHDGNDHQLTNLVDELKWIAARDLRCQDYDGDDIQKIVAAVLGARAGRLA